MPDGIDITLRANNQASKPIDETEKSLRRTKETAESFSKSVASYFSGEILAHWAERAALGVRNLAREFIATATAAEDMRRRLDRVTGGQGRAWFNEIDDWTRTLPISTETATEALIRMRDLGLRPVASELRTIADAAYALGGDTEGNFRAIADQLAMIAQRGELGGRALMGLTMLGIPAFEILQRRLNVTREELQDLGASGISANEVLRELYAGLREEFGGQADRFADDWSGMVKQISEEWDQFKRDVMEAGAFDALKVVLTAIVDQVHELAADGTLKDWAVQTAMVVVDAFKTIIEAVDLVLNALDSVRYFVKAGGRLSSATFKGAAITAGLPPEKTALYDALDKQLSNEMKDIELGVIKRQDRFARLESTLNQMMAQAVGGGPPKNPTGGTGISKGTGAGGFNQAPSDTWVENYRESMRNARALELTANADRKLRLDQARQLQEMEAQALAAKLDAEREAADELNRLHLTEADQARAALDRQVEAWRNAGVDIYTLERAEAARRVEIVKIEEEEKTRLRQEAHEQALQFSDDWKTGFDKGWKTWTDSVGGMYSVGFNVAQGTAQAMTRAFDDGFFNVFTGRVKGLADVMRTFAEGVLRSITGELGGQATKAVIGSLGLGSLFGGARAGGGPVTAGSVYLVGERGPELFAPTQSGVISPTGTAPNVTVNIVNQTSTGVSGRVGSVQRNGSGMVVDVVISEIQRGNPQLLGAIQQAANGR